MYLVHYKRNDLFLSYIHWKIVDLSLGGNWSKSLWHFLSGGSESNWDTKHLPDWQSLPGQRHAGWYKICFLQLTATVLHRGLKVSSTEIQLHKRRLHVLPCASCLFCKYLSVSELLTPGKEGSRSHQLQQNIVCVCRTRSVGLHWVGGLP